MSSLKSMSLSSWLLAAVICLLLSLGCGLRFASLGQQSLWVDELFSADIIINRPLLAVPGQPWLERTNLGHIKPDATFWTVKGADQSPPLFELTGKLLIPMFGDGEWGLRMGSALPAALLLLWLGWRAWRGRAAPEGLVCLTVLALASVSGLLVFYAQEARAYSLGMALVTVLVLKFWQRLAHGWQQALLPGWAEMALATAACMAHYNALMLTGLLWVAYALEAVRRRNWQVLVRMSAAGWVVLAWLFIGYHGMEAARRGDIGWMPPMDYGAALGLVAYNLAQQALGYPFMVLAVALACLAASVAWRGRGSLVPSQEEAAIRRQCSGAVAAMTLLLVAYLLLAAYVVHKSRIENLRHLVFVLPVIFIMTGMAVATASAGRQWLAGLLVVALAATQVPGLRVAQAWEKVDYRGASAFLLQGLHDGDPVMIGQMANALGSQSYYLNMRSGRAMHMRVLTGPEAIAGTCTDMAEQPRWGVMASTYHTELIHMLEQSCGSGWRIDRFHALGVLAQVWIRLPP